MARSIVGSLLSSYRLSLIASAIAATYGTSVLAAAESASAPAEASTETESAGGGIEEIVVTVRRRAENAQKTPVSVTILSGNDLLRGGIKEVRDLTATVPGVNLTGAGTAVNTVFSIRGMSRGNIGSAQPAAATYVNEVPLPVWGSNISTYDLASIQVLKGPQGTLFGRNTTAGAVLVTTQKPTHELGGVVRTTLGSHKWNQYEAALNVPLIQNKLALRLAGQIDRRDGYTENMVVKGQDLDSRHRDNVRASLLFEPTESLSNLTVLESNTIDETSSAILINYFRGQTADFFPWLNNTTRYTVIGDPQSGVPCNNDPRCSVAYAVQRQQAAGPRKAWGDLPNTVDSRQRSVSNTTSFELGPVTFKNIFSHREVEVDTFNDNDGSDLPMINAHNIVSQKQASDEFQLSGTALEGNLDYIVGLFWIEAKPEDANRLTTQTYGAYGTPLDRPVTARPFNGASGAGAYFWDESKAAFGQISYKLGGLANVLEPLSVDLGVRRTKDEQRACVAPGQLEANAPVGPGGCATATGSSQASTESKKTTYTLGLNYQVTDDLLLYAVTRAGYRAGGLNTPKFGTELEPYQGYKPEEVQDVELGMKSEWNIGEVVGRFNLAAYRGDYEGLQANLTTSSIPDPDGDGNPVNNPTTFYVNAGDATIQGIETELTVLPLDGLELSLGGAWIDKEITKVTFTSPPHLPPTLATKKSIETFAFLGSPDYSYTATVKYLLPLKTDLGEVQFSAKYFRISDVAYGTVSAEGYDKVDVRADWFGVLQSNFDVAVFATNLADEEAIVGSAANGAGLGASSGFYNEPRIVGATLSYNFGR